MIRKHIFLCIGLLMISMLVIANAQANEDDKNIPITADQAFDAYADQVDPLTGEEATVIIVDVRTKAEYFWVGAPARVDNIVTKFGKEYFPHKGKVKMLWGSRFLKFKVKKGDRFNPMYLPVRRVDSIATSAIAYHVPYKDWYEADCKLDFNKNFADQMNALADLDEHGNGVVLILMCRSGIRSNTRDFNTGLFAEVYEIDQPDGTDGRGGFEGTSYHNVYNGYRGFPGRSTRSQDATSVSWKDSGLPIRTGKCPTLTVPVPEDGVAPY